MTDYNGNKTYNPVLLDAELKAAGLKIEGCSSSGRIDFISKPTQGDLNLAARVLMDHDSLKPGPPTAFEKVEALWESVALKDNTKLDDLKIRAARTYKDYS